MTVTGGKLTTYRRMAEQTVDAAAKVLRQIGCRVLTDTAISRLIGAPGEPGIGPGRPRRAPKAADRLGLSADQLDALVRRHGTETPEVLELAVGPARTASSPSSRDCLT